jgi:hypothetical protein
MLSVGGVMLDTAEGGQCAQSGNNGSFLTRSTFELKQGTEWHYLME